MPTETNDEPQIENSVSVASEAQSQLREPVRIQIAASEGFELEDVNRFLMSGPGTIVSLIGDRDSGKSTLICSIYDRFLHGSFADLTITGVRTITGLEQRIHLERVESGRSKPDTPRTSLAEGLKYFHFGTSELNSGKKVDLLISDRAGELYKNARGDAALVRSLVELPRADYLVLLLDGARLATPADRPGAMSAVRLTMLMLANHQAIGRNDRIQVVITKIDLVESATDAAILERRLQEFKKRLLRDFEKHFKSIEFFQVAARDPQRNHSPAHGVDELLRSWLRGPKIRRVVTAIAASVDTEFDRLADRPERQSVVAE